MKNNLAIDLKDVFISVLNIPNDYPLVTILYKSKSITTKSFIVRGIEVDSLKWNRESKCTCIISFLEDINKTTTLIPYELIGDGDLVDKFIGYISIFLSRNNKHDPYVDVGLEKYQLKYRNIMLDRINVGPWKDKHYNVTFNNPLHHEAIYEIKGINNEQITVYNGMENVEFDLVQILYFDMRFERID